MKTMLSILSVIIKVILAIFSIVGMIMTVAMIILAKPAVNHAYDVVEECDNLDPDDEAQDHQLTAEVISRTLSDPRVKGSKFIHLVARCIGRFTSFVANL